MKKFSIYGLAAIMTLGFAACDDYEEPNPQPQTNPQTSVLKTEDVAVASVLTDGEYSLEQLSNNGEAISVATITVPEMPEGYAFEALAEITTNDFQTIGEVKTTVEPTAEDPNVFAVTINPDDLQGVYYDKISKSSKAREIALRLILNTVAGKQVARVGGPDHYYGTYTMTVLPFPAGMVIEQNYYLVGTASDWSVANAIKFTHSGKDPYDDPVFALYVETSADWWWKIVPESTFAAGNWTDEDYSQFGVAENGSNELSGMLVAKTSETGEPGAGQINVAGAYMLVINMEESTYEFLPATDQLYTPGNSNGWNQANSQILSTEDHLFFRGFAFLNGEFKFSSQPNWDGTNYGSTGVEGMLTNDGGAGNLNAAEGLYWAVVDLPHLTYTLTQINTIGVIGDATPGGWDASTALTPSENGLKWTGTVKFNGTGSYKFRANDAWDVNLGGNEFDLVYNGDNIATPGEGTYEIVLDLTQTPYTAILTKK